MEKYGEVKRKMGHSSNVDSVCCIPGLFKPAAKGFIPIDVNDPFIASPEILLQECKFTADETEVSPEIKEILNLSEARWKKAIEIQTEFEKRLREKEQAEKEKVEQEKAAEQRIKKSLDLKVDMVFKKHTFFVKKQCPVLIPYKSSLNHAEHEAYLRAFVKFKIRKPKTSCEAAEYEQYLRLQNRVYEEQRLFMDFSFQVSRLQLESYNAVPQTINDYVHEYVQHRCKRAAQYNPMYFHEQQVPIRPQDPTNRLSNLHFQHLGHLLSLGSVPWVKLPNNHRLNKLSLDDSVFESQPPVPMERENSDSFLSRASVSEDPNAVYLAKKHLANIVISRSALKVIADNPGPHFEKEWDIPMRVKNFEIEDDSGGKRNHRVVFIDKPMPKKVWTPMEKKQLFYKKCALAALLEIRKMKSFRMKTPPIFRVRVDDNSKLETKNQVNYNEDFFDLTSTASHDVFGVDAVEEETDIEDSPSRKRKNEGKANPITPAKRSKTGKKKSKNKKSGNKSETKDHSDTLNSSVISGDHPDNARTDESESVEGSSSQETPYNVKAGATSTEDTNSFLDDLIDLQDCLLKPSNITDSPIESKDSLGNMDSKQQFPWASSLRTDWIDHKQAKDCELWSGRNKHYQLYSMGISTSQPNTCSAQDLRVIIRHNVHGVSQFKNKKMQSKAYVVHPKIENQPYFGCEVNTLSEITQQWVSLISAPNASLLQVRVCESSGEVMLAEEKNLEEVLKDGKQPHIGFTPQQHLVTLYSVFTAAAGLPAGEFLLHHDAKTAFVQLLRAGDADKSGYLQTFNLHSTYSCASPTLRAYTAPPWLAIDTHLLTPFHVKHQKIPATFPMDNPNKKLTKMQKQMKLERSKAKKKLSDLDKAKKEESEGEGCSRD